MRSRAETGFSLLELLLALVVAGLALSLISVIAVRSQQQQALPLLQIKAAELAQAYLDEIQARAFDEQSPPGNQRVCNGNYQAACSLQTAFGPDAGETRASFDDVDDYHGLNQSPTDAHGQLLAGYVGFNVQITVSYAGAELGLPVAMLKRVSLLLRLPDQSTMQFAAYKGNF